MATQDNIKERIKERREAEKRNPLLRLGLGDLERECQRLSFRLKENIFCNNESEVPLNRKEEYVQYQSIIEELNRREKEYTSIPSDLVRY